MRRFFRSVDIATLVAVAVLAAPFVNRVAAQDSLPTNADSAAVVVHDSAAVQTAAAPAAAVIDLRALSVSAPIAVARTSAPLYASANGMRSAVHTRESTAPLSVNAQKANLGQSEALMVVGGVALIVGAIIGDDPGTIIMVGGAIVGLYGLYQYLQ
ncbi:MAG TPA: hypothetical protein VGM82_12600 [Gemmatimonadaceae bacterium]|jgi:hypothetical protein